MKRIENNIIIQKTFQFALLIVSYVELLEKDRKYVIANQLLKSGTSIGANLREAQNAESKKDFIHKVKIAAKEIEETEYWLLICEHSENYPNCTKLIEKLLEIRKITAKIRATSKKSLNN
ncbi:MAG: four helix bundle protein [Flavobacteriales bacterium]|nr:four helix bundle protein [Flavobacteriales bacterium]